MMEIKGEGPFKVVPAAELQNRCGIGDEFDIWSVVGMYQEQCVEAVYVQVPDLACPGCTKSEAQYHPSTQTFFVLRQTVDDALREATMARKQAKEAQASAEAKTRAAEKARAEAEREKSELARKLAREERHGESADEQNNTMSRQLRKLEVDLAKVRKAVGDRQWKEILAPADDRGGA
jgi:hypothetical protein